MSLQTTMRCYLVPILYLVSGLRASASPLDDLWKDPAVEGRIAAGIRANRMGDVVLTITDAAGRPMPNVTVRVEQRRHAFLFGANIFMLGGFPTLEANRRFESIFASLFKKAHPTHGASRSEGRMLAHSPGDNAISGRFNMRNIDLTRQSDPRPTRPTRRRFLRDTALLTAAGSLTSLPLFAAAATPPAIGREGFRRFGRWWHRDSACGASWRRSILPAVPRDRSRSAHRPGPSGGTRPR